MSALNKTLSGYDNLKRQLALMKLPDAERQRIHKKLVLKVRRFSRARIRRQSDLNNRAFEPRKSQSRKKMLRGLSKNMVAFANSRRGVVSFKNPGIAKVAFAHQHGYRQPMTAQRMKKINGTPDYKAPATQAQAKALRAAGYTVKRANGKGERVPTISYIMETLSIGKAGVILHALRDEQRKTRWDIDLPPRSFLGATENEFHELGDVFFTHARQSIRRR